MMTQTYLAGVACRTDCGSGKKHIMDRGLHYLAVAVGSCSPVSTRRMVQAGHSLLLAGRQRQLGSEGKIRRLERAGFDTA